MTNAPLDKSAPPSPLPDAALATQQNLLRLADEAGQQGLQGLQDACYLLEEAANGLHWSTTALSTLHAWPGLVDAYRERGRAAVDDMIGFLRLPRWNLHLAEQELILLENMLLEEAERAPSGESSEPSALPSVTMVEAAVDEPSQADDAAPITEAALPEAPAAEPEPSPVSEAERIEAQLTTLAGQAEASGYHALQDACLLLLEALHERGTVPPLLARLKAWPPLVETYRQQGRDAIPALLAFLREPLLNLPLGKDDFETIGDLLHQEAERAAIGLSDEELIAPPGEQVRAERLEVHPRKVRELLELLLMQTDIIATCLAENSQSDLFEELGEQVDRFANATHSAGFPGLSQLARHIAANIQAFEAHGPSLNPTHQRLLQTWLARTQWYLLSYLDSLAMHQLLASALGSEWLIPLSMDAAAEILKQFQALDENRNKGEESRVRTAKPEDVSLVLPNDVNLDLLGPLLQELPGQTRHLSVCVQKLKSGCEQNDLDIAQRIAHTLKGSANTVGIKGVAVLTHRMEDILLACAKEHRPPGKALAETLMDACDCLEAMSDALLGLGEAPDEAQEVLQRVMDWANLIDELGLNDAEQVRADGTESSTPPPPSNSTPPPAARPAPVPTPAPEEVKPAAPDAAAQVAGGLRVSTELVDNLFLLSGESIITNGQAQERLRRVRSHLQSMQTQFELLRTLGAELDTLIDLKDLSGQGFGRINPDFDALEMDQYNELHTASRRMVEAAVDAREFSLDAGKELDTLEELLDIQQALAVDSQNALNQSKLAPVSSILPRLQRGMRQTCRLTGKEAELTLSGGHLLIDGDTLNELIAPLMHLLRNAVDHGIESDSERQAVGKPAQGKVAFEFESQGNDILVRCRDDGRGLDLGAIRAAAERRGLVPPGQVISASELERFILRPNFSSRTESTQTSGRGVGLDAVYSQIRAMGGMLNLHSQPGLGMTVELRVPLPLSRSHALLVQVGQYRVVITHKGIGQIFYSGAGELVDAGGEPRLRLEGAFYPVARLGDLLRVHGLRHEARPHGAILLVQAEKQPTAVLLDAVIASRDVVIKPLGPYLAKLPGIMGATILGDGTVTPVLDLPDLLRAPQRSADPAAQMPEPEEESSEAPLVLVVDDSLSNRRALEQLLQDAGFRVRTAYDGMEAVEVMNQVKPAIVLTDLEMPRMNGIELATHLRTRLTGKDLPIIMITSRTTQRHRDLAQEVGINSYFTKPVREDDLLDKIHDLLREVA